MQKAVALVSGGADSATVLAMIEKMNYEIHAISLTILNIIILNLRKLKS